jgi:hypothetical protein
MVLVVLVAPIITVIVELKLVKILQQQQQFQKGLSGVSMQFHGTFTVEGLEIKHRVLYDKMYGSVDDTVTILYVEHTERPDN